MNTLKQQIIYIYNKIQNNFTNTKSLKLSKCCNAPLKQIWFCNNKETEEFIKLNSECSRCKNRTYWKKYNILIKIKINILILIEKLHNKFELKPFNNK